MNVAPAQPVTVLSLLDRLRCLGNGVVPLTAALAVSVLATRLGVADELGIVEEEESCG